MNVVQAFCNQRADHLKVKFKLLLVALLLICMIFHNTVIIFEFTKIQVVKNICFFIF